MKKIILSLLFYILFGYVLIVSAKTIPMPIGTQIVNFTESPSGSLDGTYNGKPVSIMGELGTYDITYNGNTKRVSNVTDENIIESIQKNLISMNTQSPSSLALPSSNSPKDMSTDNILGIPTDDLRNGNITMSDIPVMIASAIEYILALVGSICVVALIYHAVCMQFASGITGDSTGVDKAKKGMKGAILGFALSMSAWFLMTKLVALLSTL